MKYTAILNGKEREIEISQIDNDRHRFRVTVDGQAHEVDARSCNRDWLSMLADNRSYDISYTFDQDSVELCFWNQYFNIEILDERKMRMRRVRTGLDHAGPEIIKTSMPGKIVKVLVEPGQKVDPGTGIIIIEAMKMENEIKCRNGGLVEAVHVEPQQTVESDAVLVKITPE
jgi:biotin carboxyl carrier protein